MANTSEDSKMKSLQKKLEKALRQIEDLETKQNQGLVLNEDQILKVARKENLAADLDALRSGESSLDETPQNLLPDIQEALASIPTELVIALDPLHEKRFRTLQRKLRDTEKLMKLATEGKLDKLQLLKLEALQEDAPVVLQQFLPLRAELIDIAARRPHDAARLRAQRIAEAEARAAAEERAVAEREAAHERAIAQREIAAASSIGVDCGGVLCTFLNDKSSDETWHLQKESEVPGAMRALALLVGKFGAKNVHIVSKCSGIMREKSETWLFDTMQICSSTGMRRKNVHFCPDRTGPKGKGSWASWLELSHFVDDKDECLWSVFADPAGNSQQAITRHGGTLYHFVRSDIERAVCHSFTKYGRCKFGAQCKYEHEGQTTTGPRNWPADVAIPNCVVTVGGWEQVLQDLGIQG